MLVASARDSAFGHLAATLSAGVKLHAAGARRGQGARYKELLLALADEGEWLPWATNGSADGARLARAAAALARARRPP